MFSLLVGHERELRCERGAKTHAPYGSAVAVALGSACARAARREDKRKTAPRCSGCAESVDDEAPACSRSSRDRPPQATPFSHTMVVPKTADCCAMRSMILLPVAASASRRGAALRSRRLLREIDRMQGQPPECLGVDIWTSGSRVLRATSQLEAVHSTPFAGRGRLSLSTGSIRRPHFPRARYVEPWHCC